MISFFTILNEVIYIEIFPNQGISIAFFLMFKNLSTFKSIQLENFEECFIDSELFPTHNSICLLIQYQLIQKIKRIYFIFKLNYFYIDKTSFIPFWASNLKLFQINLQKRAAWNLYCYKGMTFHYNHFKCSIISQHLDGMLIWKKLMSMVWHWPHF